MKMNLPFLPAVVASAVLMAVVVRAETVPGPVVSVETATKATTPLEVVLPATLAPLEDAPVYARTSGYLSKVKADLGDEVKAGQVLAELEAPDLDQEYAQAQAALAQAQANRSIAEANAKRWQAMAASQAVSTQEREEREAVFVARDADFKAAQANSERLAQLVKFKTLVAPFDGVVAARNFDAGALITSGNSGREVFRIVNSSTLRVYVAVPQAQMRSIVTDLAAEVLVPEFPGKVFAGKVIRTAGALDSVSRTLRTEVQVNNASKELLAGMFVQVRFKLTPAAPVVTVSSNATVIRADGVSLATVTSEGKVHFAKVKLGRDYGTKIEVVSGIEAGTVVISNPSDGLAEGALVTPKAK